MELLLDPAVWIGLLTLVVLEIVLGIDNLIFIAILADKLPPQQRERARVIGLSLALFMRLALLSAISWLMTLTQPLFTLWSLDFSGRQLILLLGGLFLLWKATMELHERLEGGAHGAGPAKGYASFWVVVAQIVVLDAVFSLDSVITAVGMVNQLPVMMAAVVIAIGVMLLASRPLTRFVNAHPTVVVLCLSFLLMIGLSLIGEGLGFHIPKGYLYAAIGFSIVIEFFNQVSQRNIVKHEARIPLRERTAETVMRLLGHTPRDESPAAEEAHGDALLPESAFGIEERNMVSGVLTLAERSIRSLMTPRSDVSWVNLADDPEVIRQQLLDTPHGMFPVARGSLDRLVGVARAKDLIADLVLHGRIDEPRSLHEPMLVPETTSVLRLIERLRHSRGHLALVTDEYGMVQGVVTPLDVFEAVAGEFPDEDETLSIQPAGVGRWQVDSGADLHHLERVLGIAGLVAEDDAYTSVGGFMMSRLGHLPAVDDVLVHEGFEFRVTRMDAQRVDAVTVTRVDTL
ncbi:TerC family protein [Piscinibacter sp.]|uniref:TerC family protein n=1 Tax=Piscinibacter sp. TaxID=1903157 RepID=UPI002D02E8D6|nr:TerC family protein [Albitalea sp.]HUG24470.1 TerC family protein [Albitalea sp.]